MKERERGRKEGGEGRGRGEESKRVKEVNFERTTAQLVHTYMYSHTLIFAELSGAVFTISSINCRTENQYKTQ